MKKYKTISYIFVITFIILAIAFVAYKVTSSSQSQEEDLQEKAKTEIKYVESRILALFNHMNNIQFENYKISIDDVNSSSSGGGSEKSSENSSKSGEGGMGEESGSSSTNGGSSEDSSKEGSKQGSNNSNSGSSSSGGSSAGSGGSSGGSSSEGSEDSKTTVYTLQPTGVLLNNEEIDWDKVKKEIENLYISLPTITLDLYQTEIEDQDILNFNTELDNLTKTIENQEKTSTMQQLVKVYENIAKFVDKVEDNQEKIIAKTKLNVYRAYSKLDEQKWEEISKDMQSAIEEFTKLLTRNRY